MIRLSAGAAHGVELIAERAALVLAEERAARRQHAPAAAEANALGSAHSHDGEAVAHGRGVAQVDEAR